MKKRKLHVKRFVIGIMLPVFLLTTAITLAFMFKTSDKMKNAFLPAQVACAVEEVFDGEKKSAIKIRNTGNTSAYLRLRLVSHWVDADGAIVGLPSEMPEISYDETHWTKGADEVYYYRAAVEPDTLTEYDLLKEPIILLESAYLGKPVYQVIEVFAEAIQSHPDDAVMEAWGCNPSQ